MSKLGKVKSGRLATVGIDGYFILKPRKKIITYSCGIVIMYYNY